MNPTRDITENLIFSTPNRSKQLLANDTSPFSRSILKSLSPLDRLAESPPFDYDSLRQVTPKNLLKSLSSPSPVFTGRFHSLIRQNPPKNIQKLDFRRLADSSTHFSSVPVQISYVQALGPEASRTEPSKPRTKKRQRESVASKKVSCNCQKSKCLKLYCDCFAAGTYCDGCNCTDCHNLNEGDSLRREAISSTLDRNPNAFKPKIKTVHKNGENQALHNRGCNCSKSACKKKYCECFQSGVQCSDICKCLGCKNRDDVKAPRRKEERPRTRGFA